MQDRTRVPVRQARRKPLRSQARADHAPDAPRSTLRPRGGTPESTRQVAIEALTGSAPDMKISPAQSKLRARIAATKRHHPDADTSELTAELRTATAAEYIRRLVDAAPPLSEEQRARLAALLTNGGQDAAA